MAYQLPALRLAFDNTPPRSSASWSRRVLLAAVGALDDRYELDALTKFAGQTTAAGMLVLFGVQWTVFCVPWGGSGSGRVRLAADPRARSRACCSRCCSPWRWSTR